MAFKIGGGSSVSLESPESMFRDFSGRTIQGVLTHQGRVLNEYQAGALDKSDVAIKLPTGSGKTLVGLLIAEWRRRCKAERVVYVCPTRQLVHQVVEEAGYKYGMRNDVLAFTNRQVDYDPSAKARFQAGEAVAVTTYGGLFNANPFFSEPHLIIFDDAHAAENYMAGYWSLEIKRAEHEALFLALVGVLSSVLPPFDVKKLRSPDPRFEDEASWVDMVPARKLRGSEADLMAVVDAHTAETKLRYPWSAIRDHLSGCNLFVSPAEITFRPVIPPTMRYAPFANARQRIYMSATLGEGGDLERITGVPSIHRLSVDDDFAGQGIGRRFFIMPGRSLSDDEQHDLQCRAIQRAGRAVMLVPDFKTAQQAEAKLAASLNVPIFTAAQLEESKAAFVAQPSAVALLANRYDGIDFPDQQAELLIVRGLPGAANLQERFLTARMSAGLLMADRVRTRVVQAVGRCTRSATDGSAVIVLGEDLLTYLSKVENRQGLTAELQAEIRFGMDQTGGIEDMLENLDLFLDRRTRAEWNAADNEIRRLRTTASQLASPALQQLRSAVPHEVRYQYAVWDGDGARALDAARAVLAALTEPGLQGYRAWWLFLAGQAALLMTGENAAHEATAREFFAQAARATPGVRWLRQLAGMREEEVFAAQPGSSAAPLVRRLEQRLDELGTMHDQKYAAVEKSILEGIGQTEAKAFERAQRDLGQLLGFEADNVETDAAPDPWWVVDGSLCFVFEDYTEATTDRLGAVKARQVASHPNWIRTHVALDPDAVIVPVLVSPITGAAPDAAIHLQEVAFWKLDHFQDWARNALHTVRQLRATYPGAGDMLWQSEAMAAYAATGIDPDSLRRRLQPLRGAERFG